MLNQERKRKLCLSHIFLYAFLGMSMTLYAEIFMYGIKIFCNCKINQVKKEKNRKTILKNIINYRISFHLYQKRMMACYLSFLKSMLILPNSYFYISVQLQLHKQKKTYITGQNVEKGCSCKVAGRIIETEAQNSINYCFYHPTKYENCCL